MNTVAITTFETASTIDRINLWLASKNGPVVESFPHTHLDLPENHFSTYIEGWYMGELYGMQAVSEAILNGEILLPTGIKHEMFSHCEMYFYKETPAPETKCIYTSHDHCVEYEIIEPLTVLWNANPSDYDIQAFADDHTDYCRVGYAKGYVTTFEPHELPELIAPYVKEPEL